MGMAANTLFLLALVESLCQLLEELFLFFSQGVWCLNGNSDNLIAAGPSLQVSNTFIPKPGDSAALTTGGNPEFSVTFECRHNHLCTQCRLSEVYRQIIVDVITLALEECVGLNRQANEKVAARPAAGTGIAFAANAYLITIGDAGGNFDSNRTLMFFLTGAVAFGASVRYDSSTFAAALRTTGDIRKTPENAGLYPFDLSGAVTQVGQRSG